MSAQPRRIRRRRPGRPLDRTSSRYFVYFLLGEDGKPVYIGRSCQVRQRIAAHGNNRTHPDPGINTSAWFDDVRTVTMVGPFDWRGAVDRERAEIERHQPPGNVSLTARDHRLAVAQRSKERAS